MQAFAARNACALILFGIIIDHVQTGRHTRVILLAAAMTLSLVLVSCITLQRMLQVKVHVFGVLRSDHVPPCIMHQSANC